MLSKSQVVYPQSNGSINVLASTSAPFLAGSVPPLSGNYGQQPFVGPLSQPTGFNFDPRNLEIKTKSVEQTLLPLVTQVRILLLLKFRLNSGAVA